MCMFSKPPTPAAPQLPPERAAMRLPDNGDATSAAGRRVTDRMRGATDTILTSGQGVMAPAQTQGKTLLGQ